MDNNPHQTGNVNHYAFTIMSGSPASASSLSHSEETKETSTGGEKDVEQRDLLQQSPHESLVAGCRQLYTALLLRVLEERVVATPRCEAVCLFVIRGCSKMTSSLEGRDIYLSFSCLFQDN